MRRLLELTALTAALLLLPLIGVAEANHLADFYVIPAAAHTAGANGSFFMTDIAVQNIQATPINVNLLFIEAGENNPDNIFPIFPGGSATTGPTSFTVPAGGTLLIKDVLKDIRGTSDVRGAILIGSDDSRAFAVTSRTYSLNAQGGSFGATVPPVRDFLVGADGRTDNAMAVAYVPGIIVNSRYRTNLGFVATNLGSTPLIIEVTLRNETGPILNGKRTFTAAAGNLTQLQFSSLAIANSTFDAGSADFRILQGSGSVVPYATVIDNISGDSVYIAGMFPPNDPSIRPTSAFRLIFDRTLDR